MESTRSQDFRFGIFTFAPLLEKQDLQTLYFGAVTCDLTAEYYFVEIVSTCETQRQRMKDGVPSAQVDHLSRPVISIVSVSSKHIYPLFGSRGVFENRKQRD